MLCPCGCGNAKSSGFNNLNALRPIPRRSLEKRLRAAVGKDLLGEGPGSLYLALSAESICEELLTHAYWRRVYNFKFGECIRVRRYRSGSR